MKKWLSNSKKKAVYTGTALSLFLLNAQTVYGADPKAKLVEAGNTIKGILTALIVIVGGIACAKIVIKYLPSIDEPNEKNAMWKSLGSALLVTAIGGALVWLVPWAYALLN